MDPRDSDDEKAWLQKVAQALRGLRFGEVTLVVQDGKVIQIERLEKVRLSRG